jgi:hypothetical protein
MDIIMQHLIACGFDSIRRRRSLVNIILFYFALETILTNEANGKLKLKTNNKVVLSSWEGCA